MCSTVQHSQVTEDMSPLTTWLIDRPRQWLLQVNRPQPKPELQTLQTAVQRGRPFGSTPWQAVIAHNLCLESTFRPRGRPKKTSNWTYSFFPFKCPSRGHSVPTGWASRHAIPHHLPGKNLHNPISNAPPEENGSCRAIWHADCSSAEPQGEPAMPGPCRQSRGLAVVIKQ